jgi:hypothetical protein
MMALLLAAFIGTPELYSRLLPDQLSGDFVEVVGSVREVRLSGHDADMVERGYYEQLLNVQNFNSQLWQVYASWPLNWSRLEDTGVLRPTADFLKQELVPLKQIHFRNATLTTNRWAMRDQDYGKTCPANVCRIALLGSSHVMGYGVNDDQTFDAHVERRLNSGEMTGRPRFEVLNFAVDGYCPLQEFYLAEQKTFDFAPHIVLHFAHGGADYRSANHCAEMARTGIPIPYSEIENIIQRAGIDRRTSKVEAERRIQAFRPEIISWAYQHFVNQCRAKAALPVWIYLPAVGETRGANVERLMQYAKAAGFVVLDLSNCYRGHDPKSIWFGEWDHHPNSLGHKLIADELLDLLMSNPDVRKAARFNNG